MVKSKRKRVRAIIEEYLAQHPEADVREISRFLGISRQRLYVYLRMEAIPTPLMKKTARITEHEVEILRYIAGGYNNEQIAKFIGRSHHTIKNSVAVILAKLNADNRFQAVELAIKQGLIPSPTVYSLKASKRSSKK